MVKKCPNCNHFVSDMASTCPHCGAILKENISLSDDVSNKEKSFQESLNSEIKSVNVSQSTQSAQPVIVNQLDSPRVEEPQMGATSVQDESPAHPSTGKNPNPSYSVPVAPIPSSSVYQDAKKSNGILIGIIALLALIICCVGGYLYYDNIYLPEKIDREAPRYYCLADVIVLRSSRSAGADFNKVASLPYGTELITYEIDSEWARVKVNSRNGEKQEGFVATPYILNKADFFLMNSIFGNQESKETVITTKCRIALLNYFKENHYIGKIDNQMRIDAGITTIPNSNNQWQVFTKSKDAKPNSVFFKRLYDKDSQFTDFAVIITNSVTGEKKLLYFYFDEDETPHLLTEQDAPSQGYIIDIKFEYDYYSASRVLNVSYSY